MNQTWIFIGIIFFAIFWIYAYFVHKYENFFDSIPSFFVCIIGLIIGSILIAVTNVPEISVGFTIGVVLTALWSIHKDKVRFEQSTESTTKQRLPLENTISSPPLTICVESEIISALVVKVVSLLAEAIATGGQRKKRSSSWIEVITLKTMLEDSLKKKATDRILFDQLHTDIKSLVVKFDPSLDSDIRRILYEAISLITDLANKLTFTAHDVILAKLGNSKASRDQAFSQMTVKELLSVAEAGDAEAQYKLGIIYENGQGVEDNCMAAARWYKLSAEQGHATAQFNLALLYKSGLGVTQNLQTAKHWMTQAANARVSGAVNALDTINKLITKSEAEKIAKDAAGST